MELYKTLKELLLKRSNYVEMVDEFERDDELGFFPQHHYASLKRSKEILSELNSKIQEVNECISRINSMNSNETSYKLMYLSNYHESDFDELVSR